MRVRKALYRLMHPPGWLTALLSAVSAGALAAVFSGGKEDTAFAYAAYPLSAYSLAAACVYLYGVLPGWWGRLKDRVKSHPLGGRYMSDAAFKVRVSLYVSLSINLAYSVFKLAAGIVYSSVWWGAVAVYFVLLSLLRFLLLRYMRSDGERQGLPYEYRQYRLCGILMLILNLSLTGMAVQMVRENQGNAYPGAMIFAVAAYTFYSVVISAVDIVRYRRYNSPVLSASKAIRFAAALVSLLSLEAALLARFGDDEEFRMVMTACTGAAVCIIVLAMSVYMIVRSSVEINRLRERE